MATEDGEPVLLDRTARATRGKRMTKLLDEEIEQDEVFWNQDALKDEENDDNYEEEAEAPDVYDSDFDKDEPDPDEEAETAVEERYRLAVAECHFQKLHSYVFEGIMDEFKAGLNTIFKEYVERHSKLTQKQVAGSSRHGSDWWRSWQSAISE